MRKRLNVLLTFLVFIFVLTGCRSTSALVYSNSDNWAILPANSEKDVDLFIICPTVDLGSKERLNMNLDDKELKATFVGALNMETGIYSDVCNVYAPYYQQMTLAAYGTENPQPYLDVAYADVKNAFLYYFQHHNQGRPFVLAGFSQGSQMGIRLMEDLFDDPKYSEQLVAAYLIGWPVAESTLSAHPWMKMAQGESDIGCIVSFNSESPEIQSSFAVPKGMKSVAINPLNWKTDASFAKASQNIGACFTDYSGNIVKEIPFLTGAYLDNTRGTLKVTDVTADAHPPILDGFSPGEYHLYDYQFFYRNLQANVAKRVQAYLAR